MRGQYIKVTRFIKDVGFMISVYNADHVLSECYTQWDRDNI